MANPFPFTAGQVLTAAQMNGIGETATYTPTTTNITLGNGTITARYVQIQKLVWVSITFTFGSTSSLTGSPTFTLPVTAQAASPVTAGQVIITDAAVTFYRGAVDISTTVARPFVDVSSGTYLQTPTLNISSTVPMTWANTDVLRMQFVYEAA